MSEDGGQRSGVGKGQKLELGGQRSEIDPQIKCVSCKGTKTQKER